jgi:glycyl-tRNA synthetase beta chain
MTDFLLELFSEEIPARFQETAAVYLKDTLVADLKKAGLKDLTTAQFYYTPRRLCVHMTGIPTESQSTLDEKRGPKIDAPEQAINGFLKTTGLTLGQLEIRETDKGKFYFANIRNDGKKTTDILAEVIPNIIRNFPWAKSMRWGTGSLRWVRPLHHIVCVFNGEIVRFSVDAIQSDNVTFGHRFLASDTITVTDFADYKEKLKNAYVILDQNERKNHIINTITEKLKPLNVSLIEDEGLLNEVTNLVEYPVPLIGTIDAHFQDLPPELLTLTMKSHQKYFSGQCHRTGKITHYITVSNMKTADNGATILKGNQRVLAARLSDAQFFYEQDLQKPLLEHGEKLKNVTYHAKLGSQQDRIERIGKLAEMLAPLTRANSDLVNRAVLLAKCDLMTGVVGEFPELQGVMGKYYALSQGEHPDVADAIQNHYSPKGLDDSVPSDPVAITLAIADRLDQLCGFWIINEKPTGSKDPYALRRAALGIIRILVGNDLSINLLPIIKTAHNIYTPYGNIDFIDDLFGFFHDRLKVYILDTKNHLHHTKPYFNTIRHDIVNAVLVGDNFYTIVDNAKILNYFMQTSKGLDLLANYKRASNIVKAEEKKDSCDYKTSVDISDVTTEYEKSLAHALTEFKKSDDFKQNLETLTLLNPLITAFFDNLIVNDDNPVVRIHRLNLLGSFRGLCNSVCTFDKIESV